MVMMLSKRTQGILDALATAHSEATGDAQAAITSAIIQLRTLDAAYWGCKRRRRELENQVVRLTEEVARLKYELDEALLSVRVLTEELDEQRRWLKDEIDEALEAVEVLVEDLDGQRRDSDGWAAGWAK